MEVHLVFRFLLPTDGGHYSVLINFSLVGNSVLDFIVLESSVSEG